MTTSNPKPDRTGHVAAATLDNREDGPAPAPASRAATAADARAELADLRARVEAAKSLQPQPHELHCRDCFHRGRNAAIRAIVGE